jgi:hypothetical protein
MGYETEDSVKQELRDLLRRLRTHGCAPSDDQAVQVAEMLVQIWRLAPELAQDMVEEALVCPSWPTVAMCHLRLQAARLGKRGQIAVDGGAASGPGGVRLMQPDWRLQVGRPSSRTSSAAEVATRSTALHPGRRPGRTLRPSPAAVELDGPSGPRPRGQPGCDVCSLRRDLIARPKYTRASSRCERWSRAAPPGLGLHHRAAPRGLAQGCRGGRWVGTRSYGTCGRESWTCGSCSRQPVSRTTGPSSPGASSTLRKP